jgi:DNA-binding transcriptional MerR regulator
VETRYSIKDLEQLSGIKAHTLRAWEQRYKLIVPKRTSTNIRYYSDSDLRMVLNTATLLDNGFKIGAVAKMSEEEVRSEALNATPYKGEFSQEIKELKLHTLSFDIQGFESTISRCVLDHGVHVTFKDIIGDYIEILGRLWLAESISISQEHFMSSLIRQKLFAAIDKLELPQKPKKTFGIFLPANELHEIGALYLTYVLRERGFEVFYLGQSLPKEYLKDLLQARNVDGLISVFTTAPDSDSVEEYLHELDEIVREYTAHVYVTGFQLRDFDFTKTPPRVSVYSSLKELESEL